MTIDTPHPETIVLHTGYRSDPTTGAVAAPIYQTTSYQFADSQQAERFPLLNRPGPSYHGAVWTEAAAGAKAA